MSKILALLTPIKPFRLNERAWWTWPPRHPNCRSTFTPIP